MSIHRLLAVAVLALLAVAAAARGQGTSGQVPGPMSTFELRSTLEIYVRPSPAEWETIESLHDDYREAFRQLREGEIEKFLLEMRSMQQAMPTRRSMEDFLRKYDRIQDRIALIDGTLFDGIAAIVGEERRDGVERAREHRTRQRYGSGVMGMMGGNSGTRVDVSGLALALELTPPQREAIDPTLRAYERSLTSLLRMLSESSSKGWLTAFDEMDRLGLAGMAQEDLMADPERMTQLMEAMQQSMRKAGEQAAKIASDITSLNVRTFRAVVGSLEGDQARRFRNRFVAAAYPELSWAGRDTEKLFRAAMRLRSIDADTKARIELAYASWQSADDALVEEGMKRLDEWNRGRTPFDFDPAQWESHSQLMQEHAQKRSELASRHRSELSSLVGAERMRKLEAFISDGKNAAADPFDLTGDPEAVAPPEFGTRDAEPTPAEEYLDPMSMGGEPPAMSVAFVAELASRLGIDAGGRAILETLHSDYLKRWEEQVVPKFAEARDAQMRVWMDRGEAMPRPNAAALNEWFTRMSEAADAVVAIEDEFFADAERAIGDAHATELAVARLERGLALVARGGSGGEYMPFANARERIVNLPLVVKRSGLPVEQERAALAVLAAKANETLEAQRRSAREQIEVQRRLQELTMRMQTIYQEDMPAPVPDENGAVATRPDAESMRRIQELSQQMLRIQAELEEISTRQAEGLRALATSVLETVDESRRPGLLLAYEQEAYPGIFRDDLSAMPYIEKALGFSDLSSDQRARLDALHREYGDAYLDLSRRMIPKRTPAAPDAKPEERFFEQMRISQEVAKVRFERDERSARAISQLQRVLNEEQARRVPGLDEYERMSRARREGGAEFFE
jgi:hypothetical protein